MRRTEARKRETYEVCGGPYELLLIASSVGRTVEDAPVFDIAKRLCRRCRTRYVDNDVDNDVDKWQKIVDRRLSELREMGVSEEYIEIYLRGFAAGLRDAEREAAEIVRDVAYPADDHSCQYCGRWEAIGDPHSMVGEGTW